MKIKVWIPIKDAVKSRLDPEQYSVSDPDSCKWVEVLITPDELQKLEDGNIPSKEGWSSDGWLVDQYNRNKDPKEHVKSKEEIPYIYEKKEGKIYRRKHGDFDNTEEVNRSTGERIATIDDMMTFVKTLNGGEFREWYDRAGERDKEIYAEAFNRLQEKVDNG